MEANVNAARCQGEFDLSVRYAADLGHINVEEAKEASFDKLAKEIDVAKARSNLMMHPL